MSKKRLLITALTVIAAVTVWNYPMTYLIGVEGKVYEKKIPLYAKACGFLYRDWAYKDLVREIAGEERDQAVKALAILDWVDKNMIRGIPPGIKALDDHPLNIIIRRYGEADQIEDIFTILCSYAGMDAGWDKCYNAGRSRSVILSFVKVDGRRIIFDASRNKYFMNGHGKMASVDDCAVGDVVMSNEDVAVYGEFLSNIKNSHERYSTRPGEQKPLERMIFELKNIFIKDRNKGQCHGA